MSQQLRSPRITHFSWGKMEVEGQKKVFKDAKLYPGGAREWDWTETGTQHTPGIQSSDVEELLQHGAKVVILSQGMLLRLQVCEETLKMLKEKNIRTYTVQTKKAVELYNDLSKKELVGGLFHTTC